METIYRIDRQNSSYCYPLIETSDLEETFVQLAEQWRRETGMISLVTKMVMHPAYQRIMLKSLDVDKQMELDELWAEEAEKRVQEIEQGVVTPVAGSQILHELRSRQTFTPHLMPKNCVIHG